LELQVLLDFLVLLVFLFNPSNNQMLMLLLDLLVPLVFLVFLDLLFNLSSS
jgi:hypothetical protein